MGSYQKKIFALHTKVDRSPSPSGYCTYFQVGFRPRKSTLRKRTHYVWTPPLVAIENANVDVTHERGLTEPVPALWKYPLKLYCLCFRLGRRCDGNVSGWDVQTNHTWTRGLRSQRFPCLGISFQIHCKRVWYNWTGFSCHWCDRRLGCLHVPTPYRHRYCRHCTNGDGHFDRQNGLWAHSALHYWHSVKLWRWRTGCRNVWTELSGDWSLGISRNVMSGPWILWEKLVRNDECNAQLEK